MSLPDGVIPVNHRNAEIWGLRSGNLGNFGVSGQEIVDFREILRVSGQEIAIFGDFWWFSRFPRIWPIFPPHTQKSNGLECSEAKKNPISRYSLKWYPGRCRIGQITSAGGPLVFYSTPPPHAYPNFPFSRTNSFKTRGRAVVKQKLANAGPGPYPKNTVQKVTLRRLYRGRTDFGGGGQNPIFRLGGRFSG